MFHQFRQAKFADGGSTLSLSNILPVPAALKMVITNRQIVKIDSKIINFQH
jgi:hypothetical protein